MGSGDFVDVKLCFSGLIDQNWAAFATGVMAEPATERWLSVGRVSAKSPTSRKEREKWGTRPNMSHGDGCTPERVCLGTGFGAKFAQQPMGEGLFQGGQHQ
jgi:hypothetical protein